jgi:PAS domain S-box-containing protein
VGLRFLGLRLVGLGLLGLRLVGLDELVGERARRRELGIGVVGVRLVGVGVVGLRYLGDGILGERVREPVSAVAPSARLPLRLLPLAPRAAVLWTVVVGAAATAGIATAEYPTTRNDWLAFALLASAAAAAQLFVVRTGLNQAFHTALAFVVAGALVLPPQLIVLMALVQHVPEWLRERYPSYIQTFNIANFALDGLLGWTVVHAVHGVLPGSVHIRWAVASAAAGASVIALNHLVLALMLLLARGQSLREGGLFSASTVGPDLVLAMCGITLALSWRANPWLMPAVVAPLFLAQMAYRTLGMLRESEQRFRAMWDSAPFGATLTTLDGTIVSTNAAAEELLGYTKAELDVLPSGAITDAEGDARDRVLLDEAVAGLRTRYDVDRRITRADGREILLHVDVAIVPDADGRPKYRLALAEDVTARTELEEQLRQAQRLEAVGRLAGGVAHDFNNLLTAISGYAELALARESGDAETTADLDEILKASRRAAALTTQLLAFSRKQVLQPKRLNLNALVNDMHKLLRRLIGEDIELDTAFVGRAAPEVHADPGQLEQVVVNLVVNARDALKGGGRITIETSTVDIDQTSALLSHEGATPGAYAVLTVRDTGEGIAPDLLPRLFDPFFTTKPVGEGTGLGLATVYGIVRQSNGFVAVTSSSGAGASFSVYFPRLDDEAPGADEEETVGPQRGSERVLLVEDDSTVRMLVRRMLTAQGYDVVEAESGAAALAGAANAGTVDVLVTDVVMPEMNGPELARRLRVVSPNLRVLFTSGYTDGAIEDEVVGDGRSDFLQKPFGAAQLTEKIRALLDAS